MRLTPRWIVTAIVAFNLAWMVVLVCVGAVKAALLALIFLDDAPAWWWWAEQTLEALLTAVYLLVNWTLFRLRRILINIRELHGVFTVDGPDIETYSEYAIRDAAGTDLGWMPLDRAVQSLGRFRSHHAEHGPYKFLKRTWVGVVEEVPDA